MTCRAFYGLLRGEDTATCIDAASFTPKIRDAVGVASDVQCCQQYVTGVIKYMQYKFDKGMPTGGRSDHAICSGAREVMVTTVGRGEY